MAPKVVTIQHPLRLQELEEGVCHHGEAEPAHRRLLARGRLCRRLLLPAPRLLPLMGATREESFELLEERSRWFFNYDHHFFGDDGNDQISMKMIVRTKKTFDMNYIQKRKNDVCSEGRLCSSILDSCPICGLECSRFLSNPVMGK